MNQLHKKRPPKSAIQKHNQSIAPLASESKPLYQGSIKALAAELMEAGGFDTLEELNRALRQLKPEDLQAYLNHSEEAEND